MVVVPTAVSLNLYSVPMQWMQCPTRWMEYVVMDKAVHLKVDAVILQWLRCTLQCA